MDFQRAKNCSKKKKIICHSCYSTPIGADGLLLHLADYKGMKASEVAPSFITFLPTATYSFFQVGAGKGLRTFVFVFIYFGIRQIIGVSFWSLLAPRGDSVCSNSLASHEGGDETSSHGKMPPHGSIVFCIAEKYCGQVREKQTQILLQRVIPISRVSYFLQPSKSGRQVKEND